MVCAQIERERERAHTKNKRGKPKREHTKNKTENQKERAYKISEWSKCRESPCEDMVCAQIEREREHTQRTRGANQKERAHKKQDVYCVRERENKKKMQN